MSVQKVIDQMPEHVRADVLKQAEAAGKSLEEFITDNMSVEVSDEDLDGVSGGAAGNRVAANFSRTRMA